MNLRIASIVTLCLAWCWGAQSSSFPLENTFWVGTVRSSDDQCQDFTNSQALLDFTVSGELTMRPLDTSVPDWGMEAALFNVLSNNLLSVEEEDACFRLLRDGSTISLSIHLDMSEDGNVTCASYEPETPYEASCTPPVVTFEGQLSGKWLLITLIVPVFF